MARLRISAGLGLVGYAFVVVACGAGASARPAASHAESSQSAKSGAKTARPDPKPRAKSSSVKRPKRTRAPARPARAPVKRSLDEPELLARYEGKPAKQVLIGKATYYGNSLAGNKTASGEVYDPKRFTAAHRKLPFGTVLRVVRPDTKKYVYVTVTDRGPFAGRDRIIDLSYVAAERLGMLRQGVVSVRLEVVE